MGARAAVVSVRSEYEARLQARRDRLAELTARERRISNLRLLVFTIGLALVFTVWLADASALWLGPPGVAFIGLVIAHEVAVRRQTRARRAAEHYEDGLRRLDGTWPGHGNQQALAPEGHPYASDLDLFGRGSVFERLCQARTAAGVRTLADWLLTPASSQSVRERQAAVAELASGLDLREDLALAGHTLQAEIEPEFLARWGEIEARLAPAAMTRARMVASVVALANTTALVLWASGVTGFGPLAVTLLLTALAHAPYRAFIKEVALGIERPRRELEQAAAIMRRLETESFEAPLLRRLAAELSAGEGSASAAIARLGRIVAWFEVQNSSVTLPLTFGWMWGVHFGTAIEAWRVQHGRTIARWFAALGEIEALASLAAYAYEREHDTAPELLDDGPPRLEAERLGHPLLSDAQCVRNPVALGPDRRALIVSGSNMAGKSTYLRSVGLAVVLAQAGAPVCAHRLRLTRLRVGATLRVQDSLQGGASRFFAEITRLRAVVELAADDRHVLFLLDEILHGTNSHDRRVGAEALVAGLLQRGAIGLVTTHDLALAEATRSLPDTDNVHFADRLDEGTLVFDYTLRPGVVKTSNALALMRSIGLDV